MRPRIFANRKRLIDRLSGMDSRAAIEFLGLYVKKHIPVFLEREKPCFVVSVSSHTTYKLYLEFYRLIDKSDEPELIAINIPYD